MFLQVICFLSLIMVPLCRGYPLNAVQPVGFPLNRVSEDDFDPNPQYSYGYEVKDIITGDEKDQHETRDGDTVQGSYSLIEADGTKRIVEYTADPVNGFNAVVHKENQKQPVQVLTHTQPVVAHAPIVTRTPILTHTPIFTHAPIVGHTPIAYNLHAPIQISPNGFTLLHH